MILKTARVRLAEAGSDSFVRQSSVYLSGNVINAALPLLLLPILTRFLTPTDYGIVATSVVLIQVLTMTVGLNTSGLIVRSHFGEASDVLRALVSTNFMLSGAVAGVLILAMIGAGGLVETLTKFPAGWAPLLVVIALTTVIQGVYLGLIQARNEARRYVSVQILGNALNLTLSLLLVVAFGMDWEGRMLAILISGVVIAAICMRGLVGRLQVLAVAFEQRAVRSLLAFGVPLIPHFVGGWVMSMAPRLYLNHLATVADTGLFGVGYNVASPIALVAGAANQAYVPALFGRLSRPESLDRIRLCKMLLVGAAALLAMALVYGLAASWFLPLIVGPRFYQAADYVMWLGLAFAMQGVYFVFANFVVYSTRTSLIAWRGDFAGGIAILLGCPLLIHMNGAIGAAQAMLLGFTVSSVGAFVASRKAYPMPWSGAARSLLGSLVGRAGASSNGSGGEERL